MADAPVELDDSLFYLCKDVVFADERGPCGASFGCGFRFWRRDNANPYVCLYRVWEAKAIANYRAVFEGAQADVHFVF